MRTPLTLVAFILGLVVLFGLSVSLGEAFGPLIGRGVGAPPGQVPDGQPPGHGDHPGAPGDPGGLSMSDQGYVLHAANTRFAAGTRSNFLFNIFTMNRQLVTEYAEDHDQPMHLVVVRRDMTEYQHVYPTLREGTWTVRLRLPEPGSYRAFATFRPQNAPAPVTLGIDLEVPGLVELHAIPQPNPLARTGDYTVVLDGEPVAGGVSRLYANVLYNDEPVIDLQSYLGALGHLVLLREGDLAYLTARPVPTTVSDQTISFEVRIPTAGFYRAFLEFQHLDRVHTAEFTVFVR